MAQKDKELRFSTLIKQLDEKGKDFSENLISSLLKVHDLTKTKRTTLCLRDAYKTRPSRSPLKE